MEIADRLPGEIRNASLRVFDRTFAVTYALELAAVVIGLVGLSSSFGALVLARRREFGVLRHLGVTRRTCELEGDLAVPLQAEPGQAIQDGLDGGRGGARAVGVLDTQQVFAAVMAGKQPVEERSARAADMQKAGRRGRKTGDDLLGHEREKHLATLRLRPL